MAEFRALINLEIRKENVNEDGTIEWMNCDNDDSGFRYLSNTNWKPKKKDEDDTVPCPQISRKRL